MNTEDLEDFEFSKKFRAKSSGDMEKLMGCVALKSSKLLDISLTLPLQGLIKAKELDFRVVWMILVSDTTHYFFHISTTFGSELL